MRSYSNEDISRLGAIVGTTEVMGVLGCSRPHALALCKDGRIRAFKSGRYWKVHTSSLLGYAGLRDGFDMTGKSVFLSGPITGIEDANRAAFKQAERMARDLGAAHVYNPSRLSEFIGEGLPHEDYMLRTLHVLTRVNKSTGAPLYDIVVLLEGWENSKGSTVEKAVAESIGIPTVLESEVAA